MTRWIDGLGIKFVPVTETGCWIWLQYLAPNGYGRVGWKGRIEWAHRVAYQEIHGPIPPGLQIDHLCRNRACVNPDHLEPVTSRTNVRRGNGFAGRRARQTHCIHGHEFTPENTAPHGRDGRAHVGRYCRTCHRLRMRAYRAELRKLGMEP